MPPGAVRNRMHGLRWRRTEVQKDASAVVPDTSGTLSENTSISTSPSPTADVLLAPSPSSEPSDETTTSLAKVPSAGRLSPAGQRFASIPVPLLTSASSITSSISIVITSETPEAQVVASATLPPDAADPVSTTVVTSITSSTDDIQTSGRVFQGPNAALKDGFAPTLPPLPTGGGPVATHTQNCDGFSNDLCSSLVISATATNSVPSTSVPPTSSPTVRGDHHDAFPIPPSTSSVLESQTLPSDVVTRTETQPPAAFTVTGIVPPTTTPPSGTQVNPVTPSVSQDIPDRAPTNQNKSPDTITHLNLVPASDEPTSVTNLQPSLAPSSAIVLVAGTPGSILGSVETDVTAVSVSSPSQGFASSIQESPLAISLIPIEGRPSQTQTTPTNQGNDVNHTASFSSSTFDPIATSPSNLASSAPRKATIIAAVIGATLAVAFVFIMMVIVYRLRRSKKQRGLPYMKQQKRSSALSFTSHNGLLQDPPSDDPEQYIQHHDGHSEDTEYVTRERSQRHRRNTSLGTTLTVMTTSSVGSGFYDAIHAVPSRQQ